MFASNLLHSEAHCTNNSSRMVRVIPFVCRQVLCHFMNSFDERAADDTHDPHTQQFTDHQTMARSQSTKVWNSVSLGEMFG